MNKKVISIVFSTLIVVFSFYLVSYAWTAPTQTPPLGNVSTPINISSTAQTKDGGLNIMGNVGIGTASPGQKLTVVGTIESTSGGFKFPDGTTQTTAATGGSPTLYETSAVSLDSQTSSGSMEDIPDMVLTVSSTGRYYLLTFMAGIQNRHASYPGGVIIYFYDDSTELYPRIIETDIMPYSSGSYYHTAHVSLSRVIWLPAGNHIIKARWASQYASPIMIPGQLKMMQLLEL